MIFHGLQQPLIRHLLDATKRGDTFRFRRGGSDGVCGSGVSHECVGLVEHVLCFVELAGGELLGNSLGEQVVFHPHPALVDQPVGRQGVADLVGVLGRECFGLPHVGVVIRFE